MNPAFTRRCSETNFGTTTPPAERQTRTMTVTRDHGPCVSVLRASRADWSEKGILKETRIFQIRTGVQSLNPFLSTILQAPLAIAADVAVSETSVCGPCQLPASVPARRYARVSGLRSSNMHLRWLPVAQPWHLLRPTQHRWALMSAVTSSVALALINCASSCCCN